MGFIANGLHLPVFVGAIKHNYPRRCELSRLHLPVFMGTIKQIIPTNIHGSINLSNYQLNNKKKGKLS